MLVWYSDSEFVGIVVSFAMVVSFGCIMSRSFSSSLSCLAPSSQL